MTLRKLISLAFGILFAVARSSANAADYSLAIGDAVAPGTINGSPVAGVGVIESAGVWDDYTFTATAGQWIYVDSGAVDPSVTFNFALSKADGTQLISRATWAGEIGLVQLPISGTYQLRVASSEGSTGNYQVRVLAVPVSAPVALSFGDVVAPGTINGSPVAGVGVIESAGVWDDYTFTATAGQWIYVDSGAVDPSVTFNFALSKADGTQLISRATWAGEIGLVQLPISGTYQLRVASSEGSTGNYQVRVLAVPVSAPVALSFGDVVAPGTINGSPVAGVGVIESAGVWDDYTFSAMAGQWIYVDSGAVDPSVTFNFALSKADGTQLISRATWAGEIGLVQLPISGTYQLRVASAQDSTGNYQVRVLAVPVSAPVALSFGDVVAPGTINGSPVAGVGVIESAGVWDDYTFTATAGQWIYVDSGAVDPSVTFNFALSKADGTQLISRATWAGEIGLVQLPISGTYQLRVASSEGSTGNYQVRVLAVPVSAPVALSFGDVVAPGTINGSPVAGVGVIESAGVWDDYTFSAMAGQWIYVDSSAVDPSVTFYFTLSKPDGTEVVPSRATWQGEIGLVQLPVSGTYQLRVASSAGSTGNYQLSVLDVPVSAPVALSIGDVVAPGTVNGSPVAGVGVIESAGVWDDYTFTATAGQWVYVDSGAVDPSVTFNLALSKPDGTVLVPLRPTWTIYPLIQLPISGTYQLRVASSAGSTGNYQLSVRAVPVGVDDSFTFRPGGRIRVSIPDLWANDAALGNAGAANPPNFWLPSLVTTGGGRLSVSGRWVIYEPAVGVVDDTFQYSIGDPSLSGEAAAKSLVTVRIQITQGDATSLNVSSIGIEPGVGVRVRFAGIPGRAYQVQRSLQLSPASWSALGEVTADAFGRMEFVDPSPQGTSAFYRTVER